MQLREIISYRINQKCYLIIDTEDNFYVVYGTYFRKVDYGKLYDTISSFIGDKQSWSFVNNRIKINSQDDPNERKLWVKLDSEIKNSEIDVVAIYVDGEKTK